MKRIIYLIIRLLYRIPGWLIKIRYYNKHIEEVSFKERFLFTKKLIQTINKKSRVNIHAFGLENLPEEQGYLIAPNHQGLFDALILFEVLDEPFKAVVKKELMDVFVLGDVLRMLEFPPLDRQNLRASIKVIRNVTKEMKEGINFVIFPEGTRCRQKNKMLEFKGGTFKTAIDAKKPIVPTAMIDCYRVFDDNSLAHVDTQIHFLKAIPYEEYKDMNSTEIARYVQSRIEKCIEENEHRYH